MPQQQISIESESSRYSLGETAKLRLSVADPKSLPDDLVKVTAKITVEVPGEKERQEERTLVRTDPKGGMFEGEFTPSRTGKHLLSCEVMSKAGPLAAKSDFAVTTSQEEFLVTTRDEDYLKKLASDTGGRYFTLDAEDKTATGKDRVMNALSLVRIADTIRNDKKTVPNDLTDEVWDSPLALLLFLGIISTEWMLRKRHRML